MVCAGSQARLDRMGLIIMLGDTHVTAMTDETASLQCLNLITGQPTGSNQTFYREPDTSMSVPAWQLQATTIETGEHGRHPISGLSLKQFQKTNLSNTQVRATVKQPDIVCLPHVFKDFIYDV